MILVCGEALMDVFAAGETRQGVRLDARAGGSPFNVAVGLARLGQPVAFFGGVSTDFLGDRLVALLAQEGVQTEHVLRLQAPTTLSLVGVDANGVPSYVFHGHGGADRMLPRLAAHRELRDCQALHVGSYSTVVEPVASTLRRLIEREAADRFVSYDPNVRPSVEPDLQRWRDTVEWMSGHADLLKISEEDFHTLYAGQAPDQVVQRWGRNGVSLVVMTCGAEGARAWTSRGQATVPAERCELVDTVGAGDTFQAALLTWLAEHEVLEAGRTAALGEAALSEALRFASRAAAITCSRPGADLPRRSEL